MNRGDAMEKFGRLITAMVTPFNEKGEVDYAQAKKLALALLNSGSEGLVVSGTTGESPTLSKRKAAALCRDQGNGRQARHGYRRDGQLQYRRKHKADQRGRADRVDGCLLVVPYYNKPTQEGLMAHFSAIAGPPGCLAFFTMCRPEPSPTWPRRLSSG